MKKRSIAYYIALVGIMAATVECAKLALAAIPNVEAVTLLTAIFGYVFGLWGVLATVVFVCIEPLIWGFGTWIISYFIYWPLVASVFMLLGKKKVRNRVLLTLVGILLTVFFGVLTAFVDIGLFTGNFENFFYRFAIYYSRGAVFYVIQIVCNAVLFPLIFLPISDRLKDRFI